jgi:hypothetical protein
MRPIHWDFKFQILIYFWAQVVYNIFDLILLIANHSFAALVPDIAFLPDLPTMQE